MRQRSSSTPTWRRISSTRPRWPSTGNGAPRRTLSSPSPAACDERDQPVAQGAEHALGLARRQAGLEVVEQRVVRAFGLREAGDPALAKLDVAPQVGQEDGEVLLLAGAQPRLVTGRGGVHELGDELGGDAPRLVEVAPGDAQHVLVERRLGPRLVEQLADTIVGEALVGQALDARPLLGAPLGAGGRHDDLLVPGEQQRHALEVGVLGEACVQLGEDGAVAGHGSTVWRTGRAAGQRASPHALRAMSRVSLASANSGAGWRGELSAKRTAPSSMTAR